MTLLAMERIKLVSTRSPWWCTAAALALVIGMTVMLAATADGPLHIGMTGFFLQFGVMVMLVMAAVSVTTEYRYSTIRTTFQAVPNRTAALLAKTAVVAFVSGLVGVAASFGAWATAWLIRPGPDLAITTGDEWRAVAGAGLVFALAAVLAVAVGIIVRHTAGAVALLLVWALLAESIIGLLPNVGEAIQRWLPFVNANHFLSAGLIEPGEDGPPIPTDMPFGPWGSLAYLAVLAAGLLVVALVVANRRDA